MRRCKDPHGSGRHIFLTSEETLAALTDCESRWQHIEDGWPGGREAFEIMYDKAWREVGETDYKDDVRKGTTVWASNEEDSGFRRDTLAYFRKKIVPDGGGARVTKDGFFIITAYSDG